MPQGVTTVKDLPELPHENCAECPLNDCGYVPPTENPNVELLIIGEAPGEEETYTGVGFTGGSGRILRSLLAEVFQLSPPSPDWSVRSEVEKWKIQRDLRVEETFGFTDTVRCRPHGDGGPTPASQYYCAPLLNETIRASKSKGILAVGRLALQRFVGPAFLTLLHKSRSDWTGYVYRFGTEIPLSPKRVELGRGAINVGQTHNSGPNAGKPKLVQQLLQCDIESGSTKGVVAALHPETVMSTGFQNITQLRCNIERARELASGSVEVLGLPTDFTRQWFDWPKQRADAMAFDIENPQFGDIHQIGFATADTVASMPWGPGTAKFTKEILNDPAIQTLVAHNASYDIDHLGRTKIPVPEASVFDTMLAAQMDQPDLAKGLGSVAPRFLLLAPWKHLSHGDLASYNAMDCVVTLALYRHLRRRLEANGQMRFARQALMPGMHVLRRMSDRGIRVDRMQLRVWSETLSASSLDLNARWKEVAPGVNPASGKQLAEFFYGELGLPVIERTGTGKPSTAKPVIAKLLRRLDTKRALGLGPEDKRRALRIIHTLLKLRGSAKSASTYAKVDDIGADGCVHPRYLPGAKDSGEYGTASLRLSSRGPNIQNQPAEARHQYIPHGPARVVGESDYSQIEGRLVAILSGEQILLDMYANGEDIHARNAAIWDVGRAPAKTILYAMSYGASDRTLATNLEVALEVAQGWLRAYDEAHPAIRDWKDDIIAKVRAYGYLANSFGLRRYFYGAHSSSPKHTLNQALNFIPQSTVAAMMWYLLRPLERRLAEFDAYLLTQVHDSFVWEAPAEHALKVADIVKDVMERRWDEIAPGWSCPTDVCIGPSWGEANDLEKAGPDGISAWKNAGCPASTEESYLST